MRQFFISAVCAGALLAAPAVAEARGCIKGALVGGLAGHAVGHGVLGAVGGCLAGRAISKRSRYGNYRYNNYHRRIAPAYR